MAIAAVGIMVAEFLHFKLFVDSFLYISGSQTRLIRGFVEVNKKV
jgi:hypothetical protein